jgi:uncharacterized protein YoxC
MQITKEQLQKIVDNAPAGSDKVGVIKGLYDRGVTVQGVDSYDAQKFISQHQSAQMRTQQAEDTPVAEPNSNLGTGFTPTFESEADDSLLTSAAKTVGNTPKSLFQLGKDVFTAVTNPIDTGKAVVGLLKGTGGKIAEKTLENTDIGQSLLQKMSDMRVNNGLEPLQRDETGKLQAQTTEEVEMVNKVGQYFDARYGSLENFKQSAVEDPAGVLSDIASIVSGVGAGVKATGNVSRVSSVADVGQTIQRVGDAMEPVTAISRGTGAASNLVTDSTLGRSVGEAMPTASRIAESQVVKALDLTQGDIARITQKTGNNVTDFMVRNNVFKETPEQIVLALDDLKTTRMADVRKPISEVKTVYKKTDVPRVSDALTTVQQSIDGVPGLESTLKEVNDLLAKPNYTLNDVQRAKEILDANSSIFNRMGDARQTATAEGLANIRAELRSFIETEVKNNTGVDIRPLNNDVATAVEIADAVENRATRGMTRQGLTVFDGILGFSAATAFDPITGAGIVLVKKLSETPSFRIALARALSATPVEDATRWASEMTSGNISPATKQALSQIIETAKQNAQFIESGAQVIDEAQKTTETEVTQ